MSSWWDRHVVPGLIRCGCSVGDVTDLRRRVIPLAHGEVLELGVGAGANFALYDPARVRRLVGVEPSAELLSMAARAAHTDLRPPSSLLAGRGEALPFEDESFDTVVITFTLCSVEDPAAVLSQARRVLKPGGRLLYLEHAQSPDASPRRWQGRIEPVWKRLAGNCHLTRRATASVAAAGLTLAQQHGFYMPRGPRWLGWIEWGEAVKGGG
jgi:ubiquinone/menaquinone biosynthesis C-methylase UbiE